MANYLYNGVELPAPPEWHKDECPYALITKVAGLDLHILTLSKGRPFYAKFDNSSNQMAICIPEFQIAYALHDGIWSQYEYRTEFLILEYYSPVWTNVDILADDGTVFVGAGTTTDPNAPPKPADPKPICVNKNINYLFGEVELPALPDFDIRVYPYVMGNMIASNTLAMYASRTNTVHKDTDESNIGSPRAEYTICSAIRLTDEVLEWGDWTVINQSVHGKALHWANYDILNEDGTVWIEGSEPVPVGGEPELTIPEGDFYKVINGQWVKCDAVRPMGGEWVKQDEYAYSTEA